MGHREPKPLTPSLRSGRQRHHRGQGALAPRTQRLAVPNRHACAASAAQRSCAELRLENRAPESLRPASRKVRRREAKQSAKLEGSIQRFGLYRPILLDAEGTIVEGHGLWEVAKGKGVSEVPCIVIDHLDKTGKRRAAASR